MSQPRVLFYVQHLLGIGHIARASRIATALAADGFDLTLVTGGAPVPGFPGPGIRQIELEPVAASDQGFTGLTALDGTPVDDAFKARRVEQLLGLYTQIQPHIVLIEAFPFGRRQMRFELLPLLEAAASAKPKPLVVTSVRDILQERVKPGRNEEALDLINRYFDLVLVHGDPTFATLQQTFPLASAIKSAIAHTGLVAGNPATASTERYDVLVSAGGGAAGRNVIRAAVAAARISRPALKWALITGPNLPSADFDAAIEDAPPQLSVFRFREDFPSLLAGAELSVSQAGYNTVCDLLNAGCRSLLIPFVAGGETEQATRAARLVAMGLANVLPEEELSPASLAQAVETALRKPKPPRHALDLDGARKTAAILRKCAL